MREIYKYQKHRINLNRSGVELDRLSPTVIIALFNLCFGYLIIYKYDGIVSVYSEANLMDQKSSLFKLRLTEAAVCAKVIIWSLICPQIFEKLSP